MILSQAIIINICALALFFALIRGISRAFTYQRQTLTIFLVLSLVFLTLFNVKIVDYSLCVLFYSLFDVPSVLSAIVGLNYLAFIVISLLTPQSQENPKSQSIESSHTTNAPNPTRHALTAINAFKQRLSPNLFNAKVAFVFAIFGAIFYADILVYGLFDIYSNDIIIYALFLGILAIVSYLLCVRVGVALLVCMLCYILRLLDDLSIICYCIDPFLWVYCVVISVWKVPYIRRKNG